MKRTFIIETSQPDSRGDVIKLDGVHIPDKVLMTLNWDVHKAIGKAVVIKEGNTLKATAEVPDKYLDACPAIGFMPVKYHKLGNSKVYEEIKLYEVSLCSTPNANPDIKSIREQINNSSHENT